MCGDRQQYTFAFDIIIITKVGKLFTGQKFHGAVESIRRSIQFGKGDDGYGDGDGDGDDGDGDGIL